MSIIATTDMASKTVGLARRVGVVINKLASRIARASHVRPTPGRSNPACRHAFSIHAEHAVEPIIGALEIDRPRRRLAVVAGAFRGREADECFVAGEGVEEALRKG